MFFFRSDFCPNLQSMFSLEEHLFEEGDNHSTDVPGAGGWRTLPADCPEETEPKHHQICPDVRALHTDCTANDAHKVKQNKERFKSFF